MAAVAHLTRKGRVTIPAGIRRAAGLAPDQPFAIELTGQGLVLRTVDSDGLPEGIDPDQAWFWTPEWQAGERRADAEIAAGGLTVYHSLEEFFASLDDE